MKGWSIICLETRQYALMTASLFETWKGIISNINWRVGHARQSKEPSLMRGVSFHMALSVLVEMLQQRWVITYLIGDPRYILTWQKVFCNKSGWLTRINLLQWYGVVYWACSLLLTWLFSFLCNLVEHNMVHVLQGWS